MTEAQNRKPNTAASLKRLIRCGTQYSLVKANDEKSEVKMKVAQSCPTLCNPLDYTVHGILQARTLREG